MNQDRLIAVMLGAIAILVVIIGGGFAFASFLGGEDGDGGSFSSETTSEGVTRDTGDDAGDGAGVLRLSAVDPTTLDPALVTDTGSAEFVAEIFNGLVTISPQMTIELDLAQSLDVSADGTVYTFTLRDDIMFHNGRRVTAEDVKWSIERAASRELSSPVATAYLGDIVGVRERFFGLSEDIEGVEVLDERTIRFTIDAPKPYFLAKLTYPTAYVVDREQIEANPRSWTQRPNGTGPYRLREWRVGERIVLQANTRFHLGAPSIETVVYELSGGSALTRFENNELDVASISQNDVDRARDPNSSLNALYETFTLMSVSYLALNTNVPPFDDVNVRRALAFSMNRKLVVETTFDNMWLAATGLIPPGAPGFTIADKAFPYDPEEARRLLAESKYGSAENLPEIVITQQGGGASASFDFQAFIEEWRTELGIEARIQQLDFGSFLAEQNQGRLQAAAGGWSLDYPDPESILDLKFHSESALNDIGYSNPEVDSLLERARVEQDPDLRIELYQQAEQLIIYDAVWIPLYFPVAHVVVNADVEGWFEAPIPVPRLRFISLNR